ncbi:hypothetical protein HZF05_16915 [Sphingomonas sp. CGMCC 1.13654]|uniref:Uncharacterized protein n=1 Tax=Sphingomonas chungangi TaxID=2683589 RepID=A0A838L8H8_9SPHN|nr:hypothetical protein [Sphingomonas chungangi]MBA2935763.1 hypothetical protein [Sphingomonas chungangi]MVW54454.1 hypothetical protein [Sphingomonas chungangi]
MNALFLSVLLASGQANGPVLHATDVKSDASDPLTDKFADALRKAIPHARHMKPWSGDDADDLYLAILFPVEEDGKKFSYAVDLMKARDMVTPDRLASFTGTCRTAEVDACAAGVVAKADKRAND